MSVFARRPRFRYAALLLGALGAFGIPGILASAHAAIAEPARVADASLLALDQAIARGDVSYQEGARQRLLYLFERDRMDPRWNLDGGRPARCGTMIVEELRQNFDRLDADTKAIYVRHVGRDGLEGRLGDVMGLDAAGGHPSTDVLLSTQTTHFYLEYNNSGVNAVPLTDVSPANGVPDFVDKAGQYLEESWTTEVTNLGYTAPPATSAPSYGSKYRIQFATQSSYGFTSGLSSGRSTITLHNNYVGFPPNDDPEGDLLGAMKVTCAHEFKHAIQRVMSNWSEGGWVELDATWMEDIVYDATNDYYSYISAAGSPFTEPATPLDIDAAASTGSYEDCNWEHFQSERYGLPHMLAFWVRRTAHQIESVLTTYSQNFIASGTTFTAAWAEYVAWNFACGAHAGTNGYGYGEAADYPTTPALTTTTTLPLASGASLQHLASHTYLVTNEEGTLMGTPSFTFNGANTTVWGVSVLTKDKLGNVTRTPMTVVGGVGSLTLTGVDYASLDYAALVVGNASTGTTLAYTFTATASAPVFVDHVRLTDRLDDATAETVVAKVRPGTGAVDTASPLLRYRVNAGSVVDVPMIATGNPDEYAADIPQQTVGAHVEYRIEAQSTLAEPASSPGTAGAYYPFDVVTVYEPFEIDHGWTVGAPGDAAVSGVWQRVVPLGTAAQPGADYTLTPGTTCFVTANGSVGGALGEADVDGGATTLVSPVYDLSAGAPYTSATVRFRRWYSNGLGAAIDDSWRVDVSNDGGSNWSNLETVSVGQEAWLLVSDDLLARFGSLGQLRFRFVAEDAGTGSIIEAAIDEFEIIAVPQVGVGVADLLPAAVRLGPGRPNPTAVGAAFDLELIHAARVSARILDIRGREVRRILPPETELTAGPHRLAWDGRCASGTMAAPGMYVLEVRTPTDRAQRKVMILR